MGTVIKLMDFGVVGDGQTDNAQALLNMRSTMLLQQNSGAVDHFIIEAEAQHFVYSINNWLSGLKSFELNAYGARFQCISTNPNIRSFQSFHNGSIFETNAGQTGPANLRDGNLFESVAIGGSTITLTDPADVAEYAAGMRACLYGFARQNDGFPPNVRYVEYKDIYSVDCSTGEITFTEPLVYAYDTRWADAARSTPPRFGKPRVISLDRPDYTYPELMILRGFEAIVNPNVSDDFWSMCARQMVIEDCALERVYAQQGEAFEGRRLKISKEFFPDKMILQSRLVDSDILRVYGDGVSSALGIVEGCRIGIATEGVATFPVKPSAQVFVCRDSILYSSADAQFGIVRLASGGSSRYSEISSCSFHNRSSQLESVINNDESSTFVIEDVDGDDLLFTNTGDNFTLTHSVLQPGWLIWKDDGSKAGRVVDVYEDPDTRIRLIGRWSDAPVIGETWEYRENDQLLTTNNQISQGLPTKFIRYPVYADRLTVKRFTFEPEYLNFAVGGLTYPVQGYIRRLKITVHPNVATNDLTINVDGVQSTVDLTTTGERIITSHGVCPLGTDNFVTTWLGQFNSSIQFFIVGASSFPYQPRVTITVDVEGFGI